MKIGVVGLGYVGTVTAAVLADKGNTVVGMDINRDKISKLRAGLPTIHEPGLDKLLRRNIKRENLLFTTNYRDLKGCDAIFVSVPTPSNPDGSINRSFIIDAASKIKRVAPGATLIMKSTVIPKITKQIMELTGMKVGFNPEFTKEGTAVHDTLKPDKIVIGYEDKAVAKLVDRIWSFTKAPVIKTNFGTAEAIKYASNCYLAMKISFINMFANLIEQIPDGDIDIVANAIGMDKRIGKLFLNAGLGYGGSCFPKDTAAAKAFARDQDESTHILDAVIRTNDTRIGRVLDYINNNKKLQGGKRVGILGLAFKVGTDDMRESPSLKLIDALLQNDFTVFGFDPIAKPKIRGTLCSSIHECIQSCDIVIIATKSPEFKGIEELMGQKLVIDTCRSLDPTKVQNIVQTGRGKRSS